MNTNKQKIRRKVRTRKKVQGTTEMPRLSVFRSNKYMYAQLIDDSKGKTVLGVSEKQLEAKQEKIVKTARAKQLGALLAQKATALKVKKVVFDRGSYAYKGRVRSIAEGAREGGLQF